MAQQQNRKADESWGRFDFLGVAKIITALSVVLTIVSGAIVLTHGLNYGVDFAGGIEMQIQFNKVVDPGRVREFMATEGFPRANVQALGEGKEYLVHVESEAGKSEDETNKFIQATVLKMKEAFGRQFAADGADIRRVDTVGPQVGSELRRNGVLAGFYALLLILIYVGLRFDYRYAPGAVFCLFHDAVITMGVYSIMGWEFTVQTMAAVLTIIGYSLNDTIVIFDRIRENVHVYRGKDLYWVSNRSINETLSRTILTYIATYMTVSSMFFFADGVIHDFARAMMIGMFLGCYSTIYVATPLMLLVDRFQNAKRDRQLAAA
jgi:preprotein translocase subunit SecF